MCERSRVKGEEERRGVDEENEGETHQKDSDKV